VSCPRRRRVVPLSLSRARSTRLKALPKARLARCRRSPRFQRQREFPLYTDDKAKSGPGTPATIRTGIRSVRLAKALLSIAKGSLISKANVSARLGTDNNANPVWSTQQRSGRAVGASAWEKLVLDRLNELPSARFCWIRRRPLGPEHESGPWPAATIGTSCGSVRLEKACS
jgi:hypothetical protein